MTTPLATRVDQLWDYAVEHPEGFTREEAADALGVSHGMVGWIIRNLRETLADDDVNLVAEPDGVGPWIYRLVGDLKEAGPWVNNRLADLETRIGTMANVAASIDHALKGRNVAGRKARVIRRTLVRLAEDLAELEPIRADLVGRLDGIHGLS
jgi:hypothetical protein